MKRLLLIPTTVVTAFLAFAFLQPGPAGGVLHAVAPTLLAALPLTISQANGSAQGALADNAGSGSSAIVSAQGNAQSSRSTGSMGALSNPSDAQVNPESKTDTVHQVSTAGKVNCGRFGGGFHGGKHLFVCPNPPFPPPANR